MLLSRAFRSLQQTGRVLRIARPLAALGSSNSSSIIGIREMATKFSRNKKKDAGKDSDRDKDRWVSRKTLARRNPALGLDMPNIELVYGLLPVMTAIKQGRRDIHGLYIQSRYEGDLGRERLEEVVELAESMGVITQEVSRSSLDAVVANTVHQGVVLKTQRFPSAKIREMGEFVDGQHQITFSDDSVVAHQPRRKYPLWIFLEGIQDSHNLGSIIRSALYFGVDGIMLGGQKFCRPTPAVSKASAGAMECMNIFKMTKVDRVLKNAKDVGWRVICTTTRSSATVSNVAVGDLGELNSPTVLVLGSEDMGISEAVLDMSDINVHISAQSETPSVLDSLNVNVAASILLAGLRMPKNAA
ncbi:Ribose methyltransferase [Coemansia sp. IMI 203386]|nr:Ribose methyltransferase [Coemansia sp. IMI 203386]